jgi:hypothetical protein
MTSQLYGNVVPCPTLTQKDHIALSLLDPFVFETELQALKNIDFKKVLSDLYINYNASGGDLLSVAN